MGLTFQDSEFGFGTDMIWDNEEQTPVVRLTSLVPNILDWEPKLKPGQWASMVYDRDVRFPKFMDYFNVGMLEDGWAFYLVDRNAPFEVTFENVEARFFNEERDRYWLGKASGTAQFCVTDPERMIKDVVDERMTEKPVAFLKKRAERGLQEAFRQGPVTPKLFPAEDPDRIKAGTKARYEGKEGDEGLFQEFDRLLSTVCWGLHKNSDADLMTAFLRLSKLSLRIQIVGDASDDEFGDPRDPSAHVLNSMIRAKGATLLQNAAGDEGMREKGLELLEYAAQNRQDPLASMVLVSAYEDGRGVEINKERSRQYLAMAEEQKRKLVERKRSMHLKRLPCEPGDAEAVEKAKIFALAMGVDILDGRKLKVEEKVERLKLLCDSGEEPDMPKRVESYCLVMPEIREELLRQLDKAKAKRENDLVKRERMSQTDSGRKTMEKMGWTDGVPREPFWDVVEKLAKDGRILPKTEAERKAEAEAAEKAEAERKAEAEKKAAEAERKAAEEAEKKAKAEAEKKAAEEAERKAKAEAEKKAAEEAERKAKAEAEKKAKEEAERKAKAEAEKKAKEEAERKAKDEAEKKAKEEAERKAKAEAERKAKEEVARKAKAEREAKMTPEEKRERAREDAVGMLGAALIYLAVFFGILCLKHWLFGLWQGSGNFLLAAAHILSILLLLVIGALAGSVVVSSMTGEKTILSGLILGLLVALAAVIFPKSALVFTLVRVAIVLAAVAAVISWAVKRGKA